MNEKTRETEIRTIGVPEEMAAEIEKIAKMDGLSPKEFIEKSFRDYLEKLKQIYPDKPETAGEIQSRDERWKLGVQTEQIVLNLPKAVLDFYKFYARVNNSTVEEVLQLDILQKLKKDFEDMDFEELFGLGLVFEKIDIPEEHALKIS